MTKGKIVLELLKYANLQLENFDQSEASILVMWLSKEASDWTKFSNVRFDIFEQF